jgi:hypothetical protein
MKTKIAGKWPELHFTNLKDTLETVQLWAQIVGKIRMVNTPWINHSWHITLYVSSRGLSTGSIPYENGSFQIDFDFIDHQLIIAASDGGLKRMPLKERTVASFYSELFSLLNEMDIITEIYAKPNEMETTIPFAEDTVHFVYVPGEMYKYWQALVRIDYVFTRFRAEFTGKCSPVHLFWGGFDLAVTRFSGKPAPLFETQVPNMSLRVMQEAYSHEVSSAGFWPGGKAFPFPAFYSYSYPSKPGYSDQPVEPEQAFYSQEMGEYLLKYEDVQRADDPESTLLQFLRSTYTAASLTGGWDQSLSCNLTKFEQ